MRFLSVLLGVVLGAGILFMGGSPVALADSGEAPVVGAEPADQPLPATTQPEEPLPVSAQPGTGEEARDYERREAESPDVQEYAGGDVVIGVSAGVVFIALIILIVILLSE